MVRDTKPSAAEVRDKRNEFGLTQAAAAKMMKVSHRAWQYWEQDTSSKRMPIPHWEMFVQLGNQGDKR